MYSSGVRRGWLSSDGLASMKAKYAYWNGVRQRAISLKEDTTLEFAYTAAATQGSLTIMVQDPAGNPLFSVTVDENSKEASDKVQVRAETAGRYKVRVQGESTAGSFSVSWKKK